MFIKNSIVLYEVVTTCLVVACTKKQTNISIMHCRVEWLKPAVSLAYRAWFLARFFGTLLWTHCPSSSKRSTNTSTVDTLHDAKPEKNKAEFELSASEMTMKIVFEMTVMTFTYQLSTATVYYSQNKESTLYFHTLN